MTDRAGCRAIHRAVTTGHALGRANRAIHGEPREIVGEHAHVGVAPVAVLLERR